MQRDGISTDTQIVDVIQSLTASRSDTAWVGVTSATCKRIRNIQLTRGDRAICVYDTGLSENPAHVELFQAREIEEADKLELRRHIHAIFGDGEMVSAERYRDGRILGLLPVQLQARTSAFKAKLTKAETIK